MDTKKYNSVYLKIDDLKIYGVIDFGVDKISTPKRNILESYGLDGYVPQSEKAYRLIEKEITIHTGDRDVLNSIELDKVNSFYLNSEEMFYRGIIDEVEFEKIKYDEYFMKLKLILQPFRLTAEETINFTSNTVIKNKGQITYPKLEITPSQKEFSISISNDTMKFTVDNLNKIIIDCEECTIKDEEGELINSCLISNDFLALKKGDNPIILKGIEELSIKVNWRYL